MLFVMEITMIITVMIPTLHRNRPHLITGTAVHPPHHRLPLLILEDHQEDGTQALTLHRPLTIAVAHLLTLIGNTTTLTPFDQAVLLCS